MTSFHYSFQTKKEEMPSIVLGVFHKGIRIHQIQMNPTSPPGSPANNGALRHKDGLRYVLDLEFPWRKVGRLFFDVSNLYNDVIWRLFTYSGTIQVCFIKCVTSQIDSKAMVRSLETMLQISSFNFHFKHTLVSPSVFEA